ncbi:MAG: LytR/AlgR family response regulator transcription factor [Marinifilaceae bacterium]
MIKAAIIDDEPFAIENVELLLKENFQEIKIVGTGNSVEEGVKLIESKDPNLLFLDIEMPFGSGFDLLERFPNPKFRVIFITAYNQYAVKAFRCSATDYLLKPIDIEEFVQAVSRTKETIDEDMQQRYQLLQEHLQNNSTKRIAFPTHQGIEFINWDQIIRVEADRSYASLHMKENESILVSKSLREVEDLLPSDQFFRPHKSHLIRIDLVRRYLRTESLIEMEDGSRVELSRRRKDAFLEVMC